VTSEIRRQKKKNKDLNYSGKTEWLAASMAGGHKKPRLVSLLSAENSSHELQQCCNLPNTEILPKILLEPVYPLSKHSVSFLYYYIIFFYSHSLAVRTTFPLVATSVKSRDCSYFVKHLSSTPSHFDGIQMFYLFTANDLLICSTILCFTMRVRAN